MNKDLYLKFLYDTNKSDDQQQMKYIDECDKRELKIGDIPDTIKILTLKLHNKLKPNIIPYGVEKLNLLNVKHDFEKGSIPNSVIKLEFGYKRWCYSGFDFKFKKGDIPEGVKYLIFNNGYNTKIDDVLPNSLLSLTFDYAFNKPIILPKNLKYLTFRQDFNQSFHTDCILPESLVKLDIRWVHHYKHPFIVDGKSVFPKNLKELYISTWDIYDHNKILYKNTIPENVTHLSISYNMFEDGFELPDTIIDLELYIHSTRPLKNFIPKNVVKLHLVFNSNLKLEIGDIPSNVKSLVIDSYKHKLIKGIIPDSIIDLEYSSTYDIDSYVLPNSIKYLHIASDKTLDETIIPNNLIYLRVEQNEESSNPVYIPDSLKFLIIEDRDIDLTQISNNKNLIEFNCSIYSISKMPNPNNIIIGYIRFDSWKGNDRSTITYRDYDIHNYYTRTIDEHMKSIILEDKLIGKIIFEELVSVIFNPNRLLKLCEKYNLTFDEINDIY